jgi:hypothetical protein
MDVGEPSQRLNLKHWAARWVGHKLGPEVNQIQTLRIALAVASVGA